MLSFLKMIVGPMMPLIIKAISHNLEKKNAARETRVAWLSFIDAMEKDSGSSADLSDSYEDQLKKLQESDNA